MSLFHHLLLLTLALRHHGVFAQQNVEVAHGSRAFVVTNIDAAPDTTLTINTDVPSRGLLSIFPQDNAPLYSVVTITIAEGGETFCGAVFTGQQDSSGLVGCIGTLTACGDATESLFALCRGKINNAQLAVVALHSNTEVKISYRLNPSVLLDMQWVEAVMAYESATDSCPTYTATFDAQRENGMISAILMSVMRDAMHDDTIGTASYYVGPFLVVQADPPETATTATAERTAEFFTPWTSYSVITELRDPVETERVVARCMFIGPMDVAFSPFTLDLDAVMVYPQKRLVVGPAVLTPASPTPQNLWLLLSVSTDDGNVIDSQYRELQMSPSDKPLSVSRCSTRHYLNAIVVTLGGTILATTVKVFSAPMFCVLQSLPFDCFCETMCESEGDSNQDLLFGYDDPDCIWDRDGVSSDALVNITAFLPAATAGDYEQQQPALADDSDEVDNMPPVHCDGYMTTIAANRIPMFATDHGAYANVDVTALDPDPVEPGSRVSWAVQIMRTSATTGKTTGNEWLVMQDINITAPTDEDVPAYSYSFALRAATMYNVRLMRVYYERTDSVFAQTACYIDAGVVDASAMVWLHVNSPISIIMCDEGSNTVILFNVTTNTALRPPQAVQATKTTVAIDEIAPPIVVSSTFEQVTLYQFVAGFTDNNNTADVDLTLAFFFGLFGTVTTDELQQLYQQGIHPTATAFQFIALDTPGIHEDGDQLFYCGDDSTDPSHQLTVRTSNPTLRGQMIRYPDGNSAVSPPAGVSATTLTISSTFYDSRGTVSKFGIGLDPGTSAVMAGMCPLMSVYYSVPEHVAVDAAVELVALQDTDDATLCAGKRLFRFRIPGSDPNPITYITLRDTDLGNTHVIDGSVHAVSVNREQPVLLLAIFTGGAYTDESFGDIHVAHGGIYTQCTAVIAPEAFAGAWLPALPTVTLYSSNPADCDTDSTTRRPGSLMFLVEPPDASITVTGDAGIAFYHGYPRPQGGTYIFSSLSAGVYVVNVQTATTDGNRTTHACSITENYAVDNYGGLSDVIDLGLTTTGTKNLMCPTAMFGSDAVWHEYFLVTFQNRFYNMWAKPGVIVKVWSTSATMPVGLATIRENKNSQHEAVFLLPRPDVYYAEIEVEDKERGIACTFTTPKYTVREPIFDTGSFVMTVVNYPTCTDTVDGRIRITYPANLYVDPIVRRCERYSDGGNCVRQLLILAQPHTGVIEIAYMPFARDLQIQFTVNGACMFIAPYVFLPSATLHPDIANITYSPSCDQEHEVYAVHESGVRITKNKGMFFQWKLINLIGKTWTSTEDTMLIGARETGPFSVSLDIQYNGDCHTKMTRSVVDLFYPPLVVIDPLSLNHDSRSLPMFCPNTADAMLFANIDPPTSSNNGLTWGITNTTGDTTFISAVLTRPETVILASAGAGDYVLRYELTSPQFGLTCASMAEITVPLKEQYDVLAHITVTHATCPGGTGSATMHPNDVTCVALAELKRFYAHMFAAADRQYVDDSGGGTCCITNVPDGKIISIAIPYPDEYVYRTGHYCPQPLQIDFGKIAPPPLLIENHEVRVFSWNVFDVVWDAVRMLYSVMDQTTGCEYTANVGGNVETAAMRYEVSPTQQQLSCPDSFPEALTVYEINNVTGNRRVYTQIQPSQMLPMNGVYTAPDGTTTEFNITRPVQPTLRCAHIVDVQCNRSPQMQIEFTVSGSIVGAPDNCQLTATTEHSQTTVLCRVSRTKPQKVPLIYTSTTTGDNCSLVIDTSRQVQLAALFALVDLLTMAPTESYLVDIRVRDDNGNTLWHRDVTPGIYSTSSASSCEQDDHCFEVLPDSLSSADECEWHYEFGVFVEQPHSPPFDVLQVISPSCTFGTDGAIVFSNSNPNITNINLTETQGLYVASGLGPGFYEATATYADGAPYYAVVELKEMVDVTFIVQPAVLPPPQYTDASSIIGVSDSYSGNITLDVYARGVSERASVSITGVPSGYFFSVSQPSITVLCVLLFLRNTDWPFKCTATLPAGYVYTFRVDCGYTHDANAVDEQTLMRRRVSLTKTVNIAMASPLSLSCSVSSTPSTGQTADGVVVGAIGGGTSPFSVVRSGLNTFSRVTSRRFTQSSLVAGTYAFVVVDANQQQTTCMVDVAPAFAFTLQTLTVLHVHHCGVMSTAMVRIVASNNVRPTSIVALNMATHDPVVTRCDDYRMTAPSFEDVTTNFVQYILQGPGSWVFFVCSHDTLAYSPLNAPVVVPGTESMLSVTVIPGEVCSAPMAQDGADNAFMMKVAPTLIIAKSTGTIVIQPAYYNELQAVITIVTQTDGTKHAVLTGLVAGQYPLKVSDDNNCPVLVTMVVRDTGLGPCSNCDITDTSCTGCDGQPFSDATIDMCGVCGGTDACQNDCILDSLVPWQSNIAEIGKCSSQQRVVSIPSDVVIGGAAIRASKISLIGGGVLSGVFLSADEITLDGLTLIDGATFIATTTTLRNILVADDVTLGRYACANEDAIVTIVDSVLTDATIEVDMNLEHECIETVAPASARRRPTANEATAPPVVLHHNKTAGRIVITVNNSDVQGLHFGGDGNYTFGIVNSSADLITLFGQNGTQVSIDTLSKIKTVNITALHLTADVRLDVICVLFVTVPAVTKVIDGGMTYLLKNLDCAAFGSSRIKEHESDTELAVSLGATLTVVLILVLVYASRNSPSARKKSTSANR